MNAYSFPLDEGRHQEVNESWWFGSYVTSDKGDNFFICALYVMRDSDNLIQSAIIQDIKSGMLYSNMDHYLKDTFDYNSDKLEFYLDSNEKWYQVNTNPYTYKILTRLSSEIYDVSLDLDIISNKGPTIQSTLGAISEILNDTAYYDHTDCKVSGHITLFNEEISVQGTGYISREWGKVLGGQWQWSAVQLNNNYEICAAKFQTLDGVKDGGWMVNPKGKVKKLSDVNITILNFTDTWWSEKWSISSRMDNFNITVELMGDLNKVIRLNEGICSVNGVWNEESIDGVCFSEQTIRFPNE